MPRNVDKIADFESYLTGIRRGYLNALNMLKAIPHTHANNSIVIAFDDMRDFMATLEYRANNPSDPDGTKKE